MLTYASFPPSTTSNSPHYVMPVIHPVLQGPHHNTICHLSNLYYLELSSTICQLFTHYYKDINILPYASYTPSITGTSPH